VRDDLYKANVNPITLFPGYGTTVYGQKTLSKKPSALDRVNVRRLLIELKSFIGQFANTLVFEQNNQITRDRFLTQVNSYLNQVQLQQGLDDFDVIMDETNNTPDVIDNNQLVGQVYIKPTRSAEFILLEFNILPSSATLGG
jgi:phage tail sheath protein FI